MTPIRRKRQLRSLTSTSSLLPSNAVKYWSSKTSILHRLVSIVMIRRDSLMTSQVTIREISTTVPGIRLQMEGLESSSSILQVSDLGICLCVPWPHMVTGGGRELQWRHDSCHFRSSCSRRKSHRVFDHQIRVWSECPYRPLHLHLLPCFRTSRF